MKKIFLAVLLLFGFCFSVSAEELRMLTDASGKFLDFGPVAEKEQVSEQIIQFNRPTDFPANVNWLDIGQRLRAEGKVLVPDKVKPKMIALFPAIEFQKSETQYELQVTDGRMTATEVAMGFDEKEAGAKIKISVAAMTTLLLAAYWFGYLLKSGNSRKVAIVLAIIVMVNIFGVEFFILKLFSSDFAAAAAAAAVAAVAAVAVAAFDAVFVADDDDAALVAYVTLVAVAFATLATLAAALAVVDVELLALLQICGTMFLGSYRILLD